MRQIATDTCAIDARGSTSKIAWIRLDLCDANNLACPHSVRRAETLAEEERIKEAKTRNKKDFKEAMAQCKATRNEIAKLSTLIKDTLVIFKLKL